ncbi:MAG: hypothetical protein ACOY6K_09995 [Pseudomonadota bacterium]
MAYSRFQSFVTDIQGNVVPGAKIEVRRETSGQPLAALYEDREATTPLGNPITADSSGFFFFHVIGGEYQIRAYTGPSGSPTFEVVFRYVQIGVEVLPEYLQIDPGTTETLSGDTYDVVLVDPTGAAANTTINLPPALDRNRRVLEVGFSTDNTTAYVINVVPDGSELIAGLSAWPIANGSVVLKPNPGGGWRV